MTLRIPAQSQQGEDAVLELAHQSRKPRFTRDAARDPAQGLLAYAIRDRTAILDELRRLRCPRAPVPGFELQVSREQRRYVEDYNAVVADVLVKLELLKALAEEERPAPTRAGEGSV